eukprot:CAMPEP_0171067514 /NCGR_PEP_ID=MMETSP0766_2-20121228/8044_1 /TAXON_ID=439317 /ORGANISM="Gambierdiscus australes, Strain CAWD 149" /LENGTH=117 /DNA_ID=CAMNT_0011523763 /DNA_START=130 /DNA_END=479 /DNA_ORIENTATION=+
MRGDLLVTQRLRPLLLDAGFLLKPAFINHSVTPRSMSGDLLVTERLRPLLLDAGFLLKPAFITSESLSTELSSCIKEGTGFALPQRRADQRRQNTSSPGLDRRAVTRLRPLCKAFRA